MIVDYEDTTRMRFFRDTFREAATVQGLGGPTEWEALQGTTSTGSRIS